MNFCFEKRRQNKKSFPCPLCKVDFTEMNIKRPPDIV